MSFIYFLLLFSRSLLYKKKNSPDYQKIIEGEGLPIADDPTSRGNLIISFKIEFPKYLPTQSKSYVKKAFEVTKVKDNKKEVEYLHPTTVFDNKRDCDL